jgi:hypothetical protein
MTFAFALYAYHFKKPYILVWNFVNIARILVQSDFFFVRYGAVLSATVFSI